MIIEASERLESQSCGDFLVILVERVHKHKRNVFRERSCDRVNPSKRRVLCREPSYHLIIYLSMI